MAVTDNTKTRTKRWLDSVRYVIEEFSDREIQERRWFGRNPSEESSPDELICMLLDTLHFRDAAKDQSLDLTEKQRAACADFVDMIDAYRPEKPVLREHEVIDDPEWEKIRVAAAGLLKILPS